ncbi:hypothetical protein JTE90_003568 [Oedothorax gibbosus]|uniref:Transporter n=1 Tax=Oedothorax gibbosus TaxID=931172 RepID=A0AAV6VKX2_9ARAC|nr:hypothetical protein JTE90_003568 [Oedothorax gibbosus]
MVFLEIKLPELVTQSKYNNGSAASEPKDKPPDRDMWGSKAEFLLSCIGLAVGIGNVWRFPYLAYQNGGAAFIVAYVILLLLVGKPHFFAELAIGQFTGTGAFAIWKCLPIGKGIGVAMVMLSIMIAIYYNVIMCYTLYYIGQSLRSEVPWKECRSWWGADQNCYVRNPNVSSCREVAQNFANKYAVYNMSDNTSLANMTWDGNVYGVPETEFTEAFSNCVNATQTASEQFWERYVLQLTSGIDELGIIKWDLAITLFVCWTIVFFGLMKGIKSSGKVVYFTATFPYVILIILVIYGCTLPGAMEGVKYLFIPEWKKLLEIEVWRAAVEQLIFSLSLGCGSLVMYASYNKFDNKLYRDAVFVSSLDFATSLMSGLVIFTVLGHMATEMGMDIRTVAKGGQGLAFVTYPEALSRLPVPQLWSVLFFFMLFLLAIDSECTIELVKSKKVVITLVTCFMFFLIGLPCVMQGGQYVLNLMDTYSGGMTCVFVATFEITALMWGYGAERFADDIEFMLGFRPNIYWRLCWKYISPIVLWFVLIYSLFTHTIIKYGGVDYPMWAERVGWCLVMVTVLQIPIWAVVQLVRYGKNWRMLFRPDPDWGPSNIETRHLYYSHLLAPATTIPTSVTEGIVNIGMDTLSEDFR